MRQLKKSISVLLVLCVMAGLLGSWATASGDVSTFTDIWDADVGQAVEALRTMGVLDGIGNGLFDPQGTLTRAEFCKMIILTMGKGAEVPAHEARTVFPDVSSGHWARGYINLAVSTEIGGSRLILGVGDGTFAPSRAISYAETVTILLRVLGYGAESNNNWPYGAMGQAAALRLDRDISSHTASATITRGEAALMFRNLLLTKPKDSEDIFASTLGKVTERAVLLSTSASGVRLSTSEDTVRPAVNAPASFLVGRIGMTVINEAGRLVTFLPDSGSSGRALTVERATATELVGSDGAKISVSPRTTVMRNGVEAAYGECFKGLNRPGLRLTVYYTVDGYVDYIFVEEMSQLHGITMIADDSGVYGFGSLIPSTGCQVVKNGCSVPASTIAKNDVGLYDQDKNILYVTDFRVQAVYSSASPSPNLPSTVELLGQSFNVADCALATIGTVSPGSTVVAMFAPDGSIARLTRDYGISSNAIGVVTSSSDGSDATVEFINAPEGLGSVTGNMPEGVDARNYMRGPVRVSESSHGKQTYLYLSYATAASTGDVDLVGRKMGARPFADNIAVYEQAGYGGYLSRIALGDIVLSSVPSYKVSYAHLNASNEVDLLVFNDVTGDMYTYGLVSTRREVIGYLRDEDGDKIDENGDKIDSNDPEGSGEDRKPVEIVGNIATITNGDSSLELSVGWPFSGYGGGVASPWETADPEFDSYTTAAGFVSLNPIKGLRTESFSMTHRLLVSDKTVIPIADNVQCYDPHTGTWYDDPQLFLICFSSYTAYYDRTPSTGGKVRIIVAE